MIKWENGKAWLGKHTAIHDAIASGAQKTLQRLLQEEGPGAALSQQKG